MPQYIVGKVLNDAKENDVTFDFTEKETSDLNLKDIPLRIEHLNNMHVGKVENSWVDKNGHKWIVGTLEQDNFKSKIAKHTMRPSSEGHTVYKGLSLQHHVYRNPDGTRTKVPIEVSICREPRRPGCNIQRIGESAKLDYIHRASMNIRLMSDPSNTTNPNVPLNTAAPSLSTPQQSAQTPHPQASASGDTRTPGFQEVANALVESEEQNTLAKAEIEKLREELEASKKALQERIDAEQEEERKDRVAKAEGIVNAWKETLSPEEFTTQHQEAIMHLASKFPKETKAMFEVAHLASRRASEFHQTQTAKDQRELEAKVHNVLSKKRAASASAEPKLEQVHAASKKARFDTTAGPKSDFVTSNMDLFRAVQKFTPGARNNMDRIADYQRSLQNKML